MLKHNEKLEKHQKNFGKFEVYLTFKTQNAFEVKWYNSVKFAFLVSLNYSLLVDVMAQKKNSSCKLKI